MIGVGVGFDTKGSQLHLKVHTPISDKTQVFMISDTREAWIDSLRVQLQSYLKEG